VIQAAFGPDQRANIDTVIGLTETAAKAGAEVILPPELFQGPYFCTDQKENWFDGAFPASSHPCVQALQPVARGLGVVIPVSFFEKDGPHYYNSVAMLDHQGEIMGVYRKTHIPDGPGYQEKYYFRPGDTGFKVWPTRFGTVGVGICWDQWFPECARAMAVMGAEVLLYPTAIGTEPYDASVDSRDRWQRVMQGHAVANVIPVAAANRIGSENANDKPQSYYGSSFIADPTGALVARLDRQEAGVAVHRFDLSEIDRTRAIWGFFRDRRPETYR
jgi:N-carbamoylputrescine amidase